MLRHLRATNFAILSDVEIELGPGMNVLTGETGAGKSLIVEAVNLLRGGRASADIPRAGADEAVVEATVEVPADLRERVAGVLEAAGLPSQQGDEVLIRRVIARQKPGSESGARGRCYVNGALTTAARLAELGALLVDLSGQHQHQGLVDPARHLEILDGYCSLAPGGSERSEKGAKAGSPADTGAELATLHAAWAELRRCDQAMQALGGDAREREARIDYLRFQLDELDAANLEPGEDVSLEVERARLASVDTLQSAARNAEERLYSGDASARDLVAGAAREIERAVRTDPSLGTLHEQLGQIETLVDDAADQLRTYADKLEGDPERLATVDERIALIRRLVRKHAVASAPRGSTASSTGRGTNGANGASAATANGTGRGEIASGTAHGASAATVHVASATASTAAADANRTTNGVAELSPLDTVIAKTDELRAELSTLVGHDGALAEAQSARAKAEAAAIAAAAVVTKLRQKAAKRLEKEVGGALAELGMAAAKLFVAVEPRPLGPTGADRIELMMASNKGEDTRPLAKIASGGELSRIMLALKLALRSADEVATYVFDEVDAGIGGATAQVVGAQIRSVADHRQVLCVTHLPQIAAYADQHFHVEKAEVGGRTETHVRKLTGTARKDELARMLGGHATSKAKAHAAELLAEAARTLEQPRESKRPRARA